MTPKKTKRIKKMKRNAAEAPHSKLLRKNTKRRENNLEKNHFLPTAKNLTTFSSFTTKWLMFLSRLSLKDLTKFLAISLNSTISSNPRTASFCGVPKKTRFCEREVCKLIF